MSKLITFAFQNTLSQRGEKPRGPDGRFMQMTFETEEQQEQKTSPSERTRRK